MVDTHKAWGFAEDLSSADLNMVAGNGIPRFDVIAERNSLMPTPAPGQMCWVRDVPIVPASSTYRSILFQGRVGPGGYIWVPYGPLLAAMQIVDQSIPTGGAYYTLAFGGLNWDPLGCLISNIKFRSPAAGLYRIDSARVTWGPGVTGYRTIAVRKTGAAVIPGAGTFASGNATTGTTVTVPPQNIYLAASEEIEVVVAHTQGAALNTSAAAGQGIEGTFQMSAV